MNNYAIATDELATALSGYVEKVAGKGLSANDFTIIAIPVTPPVTILIGSNIQLIPTDINPVPKIINKFIHTLIKYIERKNRIL